MNFSKYIAISGFDGFYTVSTFLTGLYTNRLNMWQKKINLPAKNAKHAKKKQLLMI